MMKLSALWKIHRVGMFYGFLWFLVVMSALAMFLPRKDAFELTHMIVTLTCCLATGTIVTACFSKWLKDQKDFLPWAMLSQAMGAALFGLFLGQAELMLSLPQLYDGPVLAHPTLKDWLVTLIPALTVPLISFGSFLVFIFLPLACLNTWHLWKRVNQPPALPQAAH